MLSFRTLTLALAATAAFSPAALAQDASGESASGKRISVVGGYAMSQPTRNPVIAGGLTELDGEGTPTLSASYHITDNIAVEAWAADAIGHKVKSGGQKIASVDAQPVSLSGQYHFGDADNTFRPYVGLGYHQTNFSDETATAGGPLAGQRIGIETTKGAVGTIGVNVNINPTWFARADARYFDGSSDIEFDGGKVGESDLGSTMIGVGIGARF